MQLFRDNPSIGTTVKFYRVNPTAKDLPYPTPFSSRLWEQELGSLPLGMQLEPRTYYNGRDVWGAVGKHFCGSREQWENGCLTTDPVPPINPATGLPVCCDLVAHQSGGALQLSGTSSGAHHQHLASSGPWELGGYSSWGALFIRYSDGSFELGGDTAASMTYDRSSDGSFELGGSSDHNTTYPVSSSGPLELGGSSSGTHENHNQSSSGPLELGGSSDHNTTYPVSSSGPLELGGSSST